MSDIQRINDILIDLNIVGEVAFGDSMTKTLADILEELTSRVRKLEKEVYEVWTLED